MSLVSFIFLKQKSDTARIFDELDQPVLVFQNDPPSHLKNPTSINSPFSSKNSWDVVIFSLFNTSPSLNLSQAASLASFTETTLPNFWNISFILASPISWVTAGKAKREDGMIQLESILLLMKLTFEETSTQHRSSSFSCFFKGEIPGSNCPIKRSWNFSLVTCKISSQSHRRHAAHMQLGLAKVLWLALDQKNGAFFPDVSIILDTSDPARPWQPWLHSACPDPRLPCSGFDDRAEPSASSVPRMPLPPGGAQDVTGQVGLASGVHSGVQSSKTLETRYTKWSLEDKLGAFVELSQHGHYSAILLMWWLHQTG